MLSGVSEVSVLKKRRASAMLSRWLIEMKRAEIDRERVKAKMPATILMCCALVPLQWLGEMTRINMRR